MTKSRVDALVDDCEFYRLPKEAQKEIKAVAKDLDKVHGQFEEVVAQSRFEVDFIETDVKEMVSKGTKLEALWKTALNGLKAL